MLPKLNNMFKTTEVKLKYKLYTFSRHKIRYNTLTSTFPTIRAVLLCSHDASQGPSFLKAFFTRATWCSDWEIMVIAYSSFTLDSLVVFTRSLPSGCAGVWGVSMTRMLLLLSCTTRGALFCWRLIHLVMSSGVLPIWCEEALSSIALGCQWEGVTRPPHCL